MPSNSRNSDAVQAARPAASGVVSLVISAALAVSCGSGANATQQAPQMPRTESTLEDRTYEITLPIRDEDSKDIDPVIYDAVAQRLSEHFGGVSRYNSTQGCWEDSERNTLVCEDNLIFSTSRECGAGCTDEQHQEDAEFVRQLAEEYCGKLSQSSIYTRKLEADVEFVESER